MKRRYRTSFAPERTSTNRNKRDRNKLKYIKINEAGRYSAAHNGLVAGSSPAGPTREIRAYQIFISQAVRSPHQKRLTLMFIAIRQQSPQTTGSRLI
jgi:hypothetical protein